MSSIFNIRQHKFSQGDNLFLDTNVWLAILGPPGMTRGKITNTYSMAWKSMLDSRCNIYVDVIVLSEFINSFSRFYFNLLPGDQRAKGFKRFRDSAEYKAVAQAIADSVRRILKHVQSAPTWVPMEDLQALMHSFENTSCDINDEFIGQLCQRYGWTLVTDDADFGASDELTILTGNPRLLKRTS